MSRTDNGGEPAVHSFEEEGWLEVGRGVRVLAMTRDEELATISDLARTQGGVVSRRQAAELGVDRRGVAWLVARQRWAALGNTAIAIHDQPLPYAARARVAAWEASATGVVDGATALVVAGLRNFEEGVHILCRWPHGGRSFDGAHIHNSRLWDPDDFVDFGGAMRTRNEVAAVRAALWARSDRAAALVMAMAVQQRLLPGDRLVEQALRLNRHRRRPLILRIARDIADGAHALGELDLARLCRQRGLPEPTRQSVRQNQRGRWYCDAAWDDLGVVVEVEGIHHDAPQNVVEDALRQNALTQDRQVVLRIPLLGLRLCPDLFMDQVQHALVRAGARRTA